MKKFINDPRNLTRECLEGLALSNPSRLRLEASNLVVSVALGDRKRVHIVTLGGTGHEPALSGFVGKGMLDISVPGDVFAAPGPPAVVKALELAHAASQGAGVILVVLNHAGDMMTGNMATELAQKKNLRVMKIVTREDVSGSTRRQAEERRGLVGCVPLFKIAGAAAQEGRSLEDVHEISQRFSHNMATLAVALRGATHPQTGDLISVLGEDDMEIGMGQHGEGGGKRTRLMTADQTADLMLDRLVNDIEVRSGQKVMVLVSGSGSTTLMEMLIVYRRVHTRLADMGVAVVVSWVGEILTVQEAAGFQLFIAKVDDELLHLWRQACDTPYLRVS
jgi:phosphoenolpyruvate---glycerone phosphotransferase subunit DhaK